MRRTLSLATTALLAVGLSTPAAAAPPPRETFTGVIEARAKLTIDSVAKDGGMCTLNGTVALRGRTQDGLRAASKKLPMTARALCNNEDQFDDRYRLRIRPAVQGPVRGKTVHVESVVVDFEILPNIDAALVARGGAEITVVDNAPDDDNAGGEVTFAVDDELSTVDAPFADDGDFGPLDVRKDSGE